ncbi:MAG: hypothetical protein LBK07_00205 [Tannerella sp.]|jgi:hypothetical protein|nr:hypothetical protein [Tannerella sp.]
MHRANENVTMSLPDYIQGRRKGKQAHRLEREAMRDRFLAEALDGYDAVEGDHVRQIASLRKRLSASTRRTNRMAAYGGIAAGLLVCIAVGSYVLMHREPERFVAQSELHKKTDATEAGETFAASALTASEQPEIHPEATSEQEAAPVTPSPALPAAAPPKSPAAEEVIPSEEIPTAEETPATLYETDSLMLARQQPAAEEAVAGVDNITDTLMPARQQTRPSLRTRDNATLDGLTDGNVNSRRRASQVPYPKIGTEEYGKYLKEALIRPTTGDCAGVKGIVRVEFNIDGDGKPHNFRVRKKLCDEADREAIRLIENGSTWVGERNRKATVDVIF